MIDFQLNFHNQVQEINEYFNFVNLIDKLDEISLPQTTYEIERELQKILKANCYFILYNLIEGSIRAGIEAIFIALSQQKLSYADVNHVVKQIWLQYKYRLFKTGLSNAEVVDIIDTIFDDIVQIDYDDYVEKSKGNEMSGSIDARKVRELASTYGFSAPTLICDSLGLIKRQRNLLAHGRTTFSEAGQIKTIGQLIDIKNDVVQYLDEVLKNIAGYINNEDYRNNLD